MKNNFGEEIPDTCCKGWRYISKEQAKRIAEIYVDEFHRDDGDFELDFNFIKDAIRLKDEDRMYRNELYDEQNGL